MTSYMHKTQFIETLKMITNKNPKVSNFGYETDKFVDVFRQNSPKLAGIVRKRSKTDNTLINAVSKHRLVQYKSTES